MAANGRCLLAAERSEIEFPASREISREYWVRIPRKSARNARNCLYCKGFPRNFLSFFWHGFRAETGNFRQKGRAGSGSLFFGKDRARIAIERIRSTLHTREAVITKLVVHLINVNIPLTYVLCPTRGMRWDASPRSNRLCLQSMAVCHAAAS
jgi:hypothetical protein